MFTSDKPFTAQELADFFKVSHRTVMRWIDAGEVKAFKIGRRWFISAEEVTRLQNDNDNTRNNYMSFFAPNHPEPKPTRKGQLVKLAYGNEEVPHFDAKIYIGTVTEPGQDKSAISVNLNDPKQYATVDGSNMDLKSGQRMPVVAPKDKNGNPIFEIPHKYIWAYS